ncbi:MAG: hypothetical protein EOP10_34310 [Proteobacteria bacterium]|nr:MAG: hypothetical protein EOP10_34310 [Pseudomonadota bacterium]
MDDRRGQDRCPVCQGPTKQADNGSLRCRKSICAYNHRNEACPRCQHKGPEVSSAAADSYTYTCPECMNKWTKAAS